MTDRNQSDISDDPEVLRRLNQPQQERLTEILDDYLRKMEAGEAVDRSDLVAAHPELGEALTEYLTKLDELNRMVGGDAPSSEIIGKQLGDFRLIRELGRGGMGIVYLAQQISLDRMVAVKLLPFASLLEPKYIERFKNEARAAAQLEHPNIVPVYSIGLDDGIHYYAMRYITGQSLDQVIAAARAEADESATPRKLTAEHLSKLLQQFAEVAEALHRAHEYGVVHRDIKPSNLLLDSQGKLWLADFGLARFQTDVPLTRTGEMIGTMRYMSPEQAAGRAELIDHRTDIYSLAITLYEAISLEHAVTGVEGPALLRTIEQETPTRLRKLCPGLPVDVQTLVEKAMAKYRDDRYTSADLFAQDLRRASSGFPILAARMSPLLRLWRWAEKRVNVLLASAGVMLAAIIGLTVSVWMVSTERSIAEKNLSTAYKNFITARGAMDDLYSVAENLVDMPGTEQVQDSSLGIIRNYYMQFASEVANDRTLQADLAKTYRRIGRLTEKLESPDAAIEFYLKADATYKELRNHPQPYLHLDADEAENLNALGLAYTRAGQPTRATEAFEAALNIQSAASQTDKPSNDNPSDADLEQRVALALTKNNFGLLLKRNGELQKAEAMYREAIDSLSQAVKERPDDQLALRALGAALSNLGSIQSETDPLSAKQTILRALDFQLPMAEQSSSPLRASLDIVASYTNLASALFKANDWAGAEAANRNAVAISKQLVAIAPKVNWYKLDLATNQNNLGLALRKQNKLQDAAAAFRESIRLQTLVSDEDPQNHSLASNLGSVHNNLAMIFQAQNAFPNARDELAKAIQLQQSAVSADPKSASFRENLGKSLANLTLVLRQLGDVDGESAALLQQRELWKSDAVKLTNVAEEFALLCTRSPQLVEELITTTQLCRAAGVKMDELLNRPAFRSLPSQVRDQLQ